MGRNSLFVFLCLFPLNPSRPKQVDRHLQIGEKSLNLPTASHCPFLCCLIAQTLAPSYWSLDRSSAHRSIKKLLFFSFLGGGPHLTVLSVYSSLCSISLLVGLREPYGIPFLVPGTKSRMASCKASLLFSKLQCNLDARKLKLVG